MVNDDDGMPIPFRVLWSDGIALRTASLNGNLVNSVFFMPGSRVDLFIPSASVNMRAKLVGHWAPTQLCCFPVFCSPQCSSNRAVQSQTPKFQWRRVGAVYEMQWKRPQERTLLAMIRMRQLRDIAA